jgi:hypothetical protein
MERQASLMASLRSPNRIMPAAETMAVPNAAQTCHKKNNNNIKTHTHTQKSNAVKMDEDKKLRNRKGVAIVVIVTTRRHSARQSFSHPMYSIRTA